MSLQNGDEKVEITFMTVFDDSYVYPFLVFFFSLIRSGTNINKFSIFFSEDTLSQSMQDLLLDFSKLFEVNFNLVSLKIDTELPISETFNETTWCKLFAINNLSGIVVYLDVDTLVLQNLDILNNPELIPNEIEIISAVIDPGVDMNTKTNKAIIRSKGRYFNAGFMIINVDGWKKNQFDLECMDVIHSYGELGLQWLDQCVFNYLCASTFRDISSTYNSFARPEIELREIKVLHFAGSSKKPWKLPLNLLHRYLYLRQRIFRPSFQAYRKTERNLIDWTRRSDQSLYQHLLLLRKKAFNQSPHLIDLLFFKYEMTKIGPLVHKLYKMAKD